MSKKVSVADQRRLTEQLQAFTHATPNDAARLLKAAKWNLNVAVELFFDDAGAQANAARAGGGGEGKAERDKRERKVGEVFDEYKDPDGETITIESIGDYFAALGIDDPDADVGVYLLSFELKSPAMGTVERKAFVDRWSALKIDSTSGMRDQLARWRTAFGAEPAYFRSVYRFVYDLGRVDGAKVIDRATALAFWQTLLPPAFASSPSALASQTADGQPAMGPREFGWWCAFLESKGVKGVSRDVWSLFIEYAVKIPSTYDVYDEEDSWPSILDEFTEYARGRRAEEGPGEGERMDVS